MAKAAAPFRVVGLAMLAVVIIAAATTLMLWQLRLREVEHAVGETQSVARLLATNIDESVSAVDIILRDLGEKLTASTLPGPDLASPAVRMDLVERTVNAPQIRTLFVVSNAGLVVNSSRPESTIGVSVADQPYFVALQRDSKRLAYFGGLSKGRVSNVWKIYLARRLVTGSGESAGLLVASMEASYFERLFGLMQLDVDRKLGLYLEDGSLFASHPNVEAAIGRVAPEMGGPEIPGRGNSRLETMFRYTEADGATYTYAVARTHSVPLLIGVGNNDELTQAEWRSYAGPIALGALLVSASIIAAGLVLNNRQRREERLGAALLEASGRARALVDTTMDAIVTTDEQQRIVVFNPAAERLFGWAAADMLGQPLDRLLPEAARAGHGRHMSGFIGSGVERRLMAPSMQILGRRRDGGTFPAEATVSRALVDGQLQLTATLRDVTERERAKASLQRANDQLRMLADALQDVREAERIRLARELHDDLGQRLTGLKLDLSWLSDKLRKSGSNLADEVDITRSNLDSAIAGARRIWTELQPVMIDDLNFGDAVDALARETTRHGGIEIRTEMPARALVSKGPVAVALYRVIQEAVNNLVRHAQATQATLQLGVEGEHLVLCVNDNGIGFDADALTGKGLGLVSMRERVLALQGSYDINAVPGQGTRITIKIPLAVLARDEVLEHEEETT